MNTLQTEAGKAILTEVIAAMCHHPDKLKVDYCEDETAIRICILAHPTDAKIIVADGAPLKSIECLGRLLFWGARKIVQVMPVASTDNADEPYRKFTARPDWKENKLLDLMSRLASLCFKGSTVTIVSIPETNWSSIFSVTVSPQQNEKAFKRFSRSVTVLFVPIGANHGRMIYANAKNK